MGGYFLFSGSGGSKAAAVSATSSATPSASASASASTQAEPATRCSYQASGTAARKVGLPPAKPDDKASYQATIRTNRGDVVINLLNSKATCTVNSFVYLAAKKYFNGTHCHRLTTIDPFVLQCGDPTGTGTGGPGYDVREREPGGRGRTPRARSRWRTAAPPTATAASSSSCTRTRSWPPSYTPFGQVVKGLGIIQNVARAGSDNANGAGDGHPKEKVVIESVTIKKT